MPYTEITSDEVLQNKIHKTVNKVVNAVATTLGPKSHNVILQFKNKSPIITKDGVSVAKSIFFEDPLENAICQIIKQAAISTNDNVGDGTTTSIILTREIYNLAIKYINSGVSVHEIKRGMENISKLIVEKLFEMAKPLHTKNDILNIATISANGDKEIAEIIFEAINNAGKDGLIKVKENLISNKTFVETIEGFHFDSGFVSTAFINNEIKSIVQYDDCRVLVTDHRLSDVKEMLPLLEMVAHDKKPFIIVADEIEGQLLASLIVNVTRGSMKVVAIKAPKFGDERKLLLSDLALSIGANFIQKEANTPIKDIKLSDLGYVKSFEASKNSTIMIGGNGNSENIKTRIQLLKQAILEEESDSEAEKLQERITRLASGISVINVSAPTEVERLELKFRVEDALEAVKSAQKEGILQGGATALLKASRLILEENSFVSNSDGESFGAKIILEALSAPLKQLCQNSNHMSHQMIENFIYQKENAGYDFANEIYVNDLYEAGIIDPLAVTKSALLNAISVASTLLTVNYAVVEV